VMVSPTCNAKRRLPAQGSPLLIGAMLQQPAHDGDLIVLDRLMQGRL
jgi:hypothetical protein